MAFDKSSGEVLAAQILANVLADCYSVQASTVPDIWARYGRIMQLRWALTDGETRVAVECVRGKRNQEIALSLGVSTETINKHLDSVYRKVRVASRAQLSALLLEEVGR